MKESLRLRPPVLITTAYEFAKDTKVGKYLIKAGDRVMINMAGLHLNPAQWQRANEFLPQRFDSTDPLFLTPNGKKRHTMSLSPFNGGKRICFGKTFAESSTRMAVTYLT